MVVYDKRVVVIRHMPEELSKEDKISFMKFFGASQVVCVSSERKKGSLVFAKYDREIQAEAVLKKLHQKEILGQMISVEYARSEMPQDDTQAKKSEEVEKNDEKTMQRKVIENFQSKMNSWITNLDLTIPPPVHLRYSYPPPQVNILKNICKALSKVPKFYTQVLHLMNKMNLPCPFVENYIINDPNVDVMEDSEESEMEDETLNISVKPFELKKSIKRIKKLKATPAVKKIKQDPKIDPSQIFEVVNLNKKNIEFNIPSDLVPIEDNTKSEKIESFEYKKDEKQEEEKKEDVQEDQKIITEEELAMNCVPEKDFHLLPVFKNYQPGTPSCRLYIKNLAKTVQETDLTFIFKRYFIDQKEEQGSMFDIRLMQEGRMKGQAFITLQNTQLASKALKETNGYLLKGKPMVVQFARSQKPK